MKCEERKMKQYVTIDKRSKKARKEYYSKQRHTWGELNPVTRSVSSEKVYNRKKDKRRIGVEFRDEFDIDFLRLNGRKRYQGDRMIPAHFVLFITKVISWLALCFFPYSMAFAGQ